VSTFSEQEVPSRSAVIGEIISTAANIESLMHKLTASDEPGLHALTEQLSGNISEAVKRQLHYIGAVRNQAAHEAGFVLSEEELERFRSTAENVINALKSLDDERFNQGYYTGDKRQDECAADAADESGSVADNETDLAVERELFAGIAEKIAIMGFYPFAGVAQLLLIFLTTLAKQIWVVVLTLLYASAIILGIKGWTSEVHYGMLYMGAGVFFCVYILLAIMGWRQPIFKKMPKWLWAVPILNGIYLPIRWLRDLDWPKFLLSGFGLSSFAGAIVLVGYKYYVMAFLALLISWAAGIVCSWLWRKKREE